MRRNNMMTSLMAVGGIALAVMQMVRMRNRNTMWTNIVQWANQATNGTMRGMNQMMRTVRRRARM